jgi:hypothetical protein
MLTKKTWPYGTRKRVEVFESIETQRGRVVVAVDNANGPEGFILLQAKDAPCPAIGTEAEIVFTAGGPTGGHWRFEEATC